MKLLLVHNYYGSSARSGENIAFEAEANLLASRGEEVTRFTVHSDAVRCLGAIGALSSAAVVVWNPVARSRLRRAIQLHRPDVVHFHNTFPLLSPSVFYANTGLDVAAVLTLHNYRVGCAAGIPLRENRPCTICLDRASSVPAIRHGCYRNSRWATVPLAAMIALHRRLRTWSRLDGVIMLSEFQRAQLASAGFDQPAIWVKPHFYASPPEPVPWSCRQARAIFVGRLTPEKGVRFLLDAWRSWGAEAPNLEIVGDGPDRAMLERAASNSVLAGRVTFSGQLPFAEAQARLAKCRLAILPSTSFEAFPMIIREAFALGVPVAASRVGALAELVTHGVNGLTFEPGSCEDLLRVVREAWLDPRLLSAAAEGARATFQKRFTAAANHEALMQIYTAAVARRKARPPGRS